MARASSWGNVMAESDTTWSARAAHPAGRPSWPPIRNTRSRPSISAFAITDRKSTRLNSSHLGISYAVFCLKKKKKQHNALRIELDSSTRHTLQSGDRERRLRGALWPCAPVRDVTLSK